MSSALHPLHHPKGQSKAQSVRGAAAFLIAFFDSSVGAKVTIAVTGLLLVGFVTVHMIGNLKVFSGPEAINAYAHFLKHDLGIVIWLARAALLAVFVLHVGLAVRLSQRARAARPVPYVYPGNVQATNASRTMIWSGATVGLFVVFHLAHFTFAWVHHAQLPNGQVVNYLELKDAQGRHDVYTMIVAGYKTPWISLLYIAAQLVLFWHLLHGIQSVFQTLGLKNKRFRSVIGLLGLAVAATILIGNLTVVLGVWFDLFGEFQVSGP